MSRVLFLTNNDVSRPLVEWLKESNDVVVFEEPLAPSDIVQIAPDVAISYSYRHMIRSEVLSVLRDGFFNLHISLLPFNRGADPNAWSFLEDTPKGVTIHRVDKGLDTGPIVAQREVLFDEKTSTLGGTYATLHAEIQDLFKECWIAISGGLAAKTDQLPGGTYHRSREFAEIRSVLMGEEGWAVPIPVFKARYAALRREAKS